MITCVADGCDSTESTRIDGKPIALFSFPPEYDLRKIQWLSNCNLTPGDKEPLHLCELHFEKIHFTASRDLKSNAVPTLFGRKESWKQQKAKNTSQTMSVKVPSKRRKLDEHSHDLVTPPQSPSMQDNIEDLVRGSKANMSMDHVIAMNGSVESASATHKDSQTNVKTYRLIIQIDKIRSKPGPKCKKAPPLLTFNKGAKNTATIERGVGKKLRPSPIKKACEKGQCKLKQCVYQSKEAFQCELCDKYYFARITESKILSCTKCSKTFPDPQSLYVHIRKHFMCDICLTECNSQMTYDKHVRLHVSTDKLYPYKCHQCNKIFDVKDGVKQHCLLAHPKLSPQKTVYQVTSPMTPIAPKQTDYSCMDCKVNFTNDQAYRNHMHSHGKADNFTCNIKGDAKSIIPVPNPLTGSQIGILQAVKFSCRVCSKEFDNFAEVDLHTRTHLEVPTEEELKCNICNKSFKSNAVFSEHLKQHLSRAHPCPICSKAFINKTTLNAHLKTHSTVAQ